MRLLWLLVAALFGIIAMGAALDIAASGSPTLVGVAGLFGLALTVLSAIGIRRRLA